MEFIQDMLLAYCHIVNMTDNLKLSILADYAFHKNWCMFCSPICMDFRGLRISAPVDQRFISHDA